jgi:peptidyl-prolyl cis-trans isomerase D
MALISKIREKGWVLVLVLGLALFSFIIQAFVENSNSLSVGDANTIARVNGKAIATDKFNQYKDKVYGKSQADPYAVEETVLNHFVDGELIKSIADKVGLGVPTEELLDLEFGTKNLSPVIMQRFTGEGGGVNYPMLQQIKGAIDSKQLPADYREFWALQEDEIIQDRLQSKYTNMIAKAIVTPKWQAEMGFQEGNQRTSFTYVRVPFEKVDLATVKPTDADFASYLDKNKEQFYQNEETRTIDYIAIDVVPSLQDSLEAMKVVTTKATGWATSASDSAHFAGIRTDINKFYTNKAQLGTLGDTLSKTATGTIIGPLVADGRYTMAKVMSRQAMPDSVRARHILIKADQMGPKAAEALCDSILGVVKSGTTSFDSLAARYGTDGTRTKGGDLDWFGFGAMVPEFQEAAFFTLEQGRPSKVRTSFGYHVIEVTGKKFKTNESGMRVAMINEIIKPMAATKQAARQKAEELAANCKTIEALTAAAEKQSVVVSAGSPARKQDANLGQIAAGNEGRAIVRWAFLPDTKEGAVSKTVFETRDPLTLEPSKYIVAVVKSVRPKGYARVSDVKAQITTQVTNKKRADMLLAQVGGVNSLAALATQFGVPVDTAQMAAFASPSLGAGGFEPRVVGHAFGIPEGQTSKVFAGNSGIFIVSGAKPTTPAAPPADVSMFKRPFSGAVVGQLRQRLMPSLKRDMKLDDLRNQ